MSNAVSIDKVKADYKVPNVTFANKSTAVNDLASIVEKIAVEITH